MAPFSFDTRQGKSLPRPLRTLSNSQQAKKMIMTPMKKKHPMLEIPVLFEPKYDVNHLTPIVPGKLYLSCGELVNEGLEKGRLYSIHGKKHIRHVLNVTNANSVGIVEPSNCDHYVYYRIPVDDSANEKLFNYFLPTIRMLDQWIKSGNPVVVHCVMGISRSSTIILAYMMYKYRMTVEEAFEYVKKRRPVIQPNSGFMTQLHQFEFFLKKNVW